MKKAIILSDRELRLVKDHVLALLDPLYEDAVAGAYRAGGHWHVANGVRYELGAHPHDA